MKSKRLPILAFSIGTYVVPVLATELGGSNYTPGFYGDFGMATFTEKGVYFNNFMTVYKDPSSKTETLLELPGIIYVSDTKIFNGRYVTAVFPALMAAMDKTTGTSYDRIGLGDFYFVPGGLSWDWGNIKGFLFEGLVAPTGRYQKDDFNTGRNYWTFDHNLLLTWELPGRSELSLAIGYMNNLKNPATDYKSGDELHFDYTVGAYLTPQIALGLTGSHYRQLTTDSSSQSHLPVAYSEASTVGPVVMYTPKIFGKDVTVSLKYLHEFNVEGRLPQDYLTIRILFSL